MRHTAISAKATEVEQLAKTVRKLCDKDSENFPAIVMSRLHVELDLIGRKLSKHLRMLCDEQFEDA